MDLLFLRLEVELLEPALLAAEEDLAEDDAVLATDLLSSCLAATLTAVPGTWTRPDLLYRLRVELEAGAGFVSHTIVIVNLYF